MATSSTSMSVPIPHLQLLLLLLLVVVVDFSAGQGQGQTAIPGKCGVGPGGRPAPEMCFKKTWNFTDFSLPDVAHIDTLCDPCHRPNVTVLILFRNAIDNLPIDAFSGFANLQTLDLRMNKVSSFNRGVFDSLQKLKALKVDGSSVQRSCGLVQPFLKGVTLDTGNLIPKDLQFIHNMCMSDHGTGVGCTDQGVVCRVCLAGTIPNGRTDDKGRVTCSPNHRHIPVGGLTSPIKPFCNDRHQWQNIGVCRPCAGTIANGNVATNGSVQCHFGFGHVLPAGKTTPTCSAQGLWTNVGTCNVCLDRNGKCVFCYVSIRYGRLSSDGTVKCDPGYKHYPDPNGQKCKGPFHIWDGLGVCRDPTYPKICHRTYVVNGYSYDNGDVKCYTNYRHIPHKTGKKCDVYGYWVNIGICKACTGSISDGTVSLDGTVKCNPTFTHIPNKIGKACNASAQWVGLGVCIKCMGTVANGKVAHDGSVTCDTNYVYEAPVGGTRPICMAPAQWTNVGTCEARSNYCDAPPSTVVNGKVRRAHNSIHRIGETYSVQCNAGHSANGDGINSTFTVTCKSTRIRTFWSGQDCAFPCPSPFGWNSDLKRCIKVVYGTYSGDTANQECHKLSGNLIHIRNDRDNDFVYNLVKDVTGGIVWLGLRNIPRMDWVWRLQPGYYESSLDYTQWYYLFPKPTHVPQGGECAVMNPGVKQQWRQSPCGDSASSKFVCERVACWYKDYFYDYQLARCVKLYRNLATRKQASDKCADHQANLLQISTPDEEERVKNITSNRNVNVWLGLIRTNNQYFWEQRSSPANVAFSQAYNSFRGNMNYGNNTCVYLNNEGAGRWTVHQCGSRGHAWFMCQTTDCPRGYSYSNELGRCKDLTIRKNAAGNCRSDYTWISKDGINLCVKFVKIPASWYWAERACRLDGGVLMRPLDSATEQELLGYLPNRRFWIGLNDIKNEGKFEFSPRGRWNTPGIALGWYKNWAPGESHGGTGENCVVTSSSGWMDYACQHKCPYACQMLD